MLASIRRSDGIWTGPWRSTWGGGRLRALDWGVTGPQLAVGGSGEWRLAPRGKGQTPGAGRLASDPRHRRRRGKLAGLSGGPDRLCFSD